jgi:predicted transcriptional regulator of viral defense system
VVKKSIEKLRHRPFRYDEAQKLGVSRRELQRLLKSGEVERVGFGIYQFEDLELSQENEFIKATLQLGAPCSICLVSALDYYSLTDLIANQIWVMVESHKRSSQSHLKLLRVRNPHWKTGIEKKNGFWITSLERTLIDSLIYKKHVARTIAIEAIRQALDEKQTSLHKLIEMSEKLRVFHLTRSILETFS